jgi:hypothetical protein
MPVQMSNNDVIMAWSACSCIRKRSTGGVSHVDRSAVNDINDIYTYAHMELNKTSLWNNVGKMGMSLWQCDRHLKACRRFSLEMPVVAFHWKSPMKLIVVYIE